MFLQVDLDSIYSYKVSATLQCHFLNESLFENNINKTRKKSKFNFISHKHCGVSYN
jgi:hypothetical protein